ncbi:restriction endonuclease [Xanthomonas campestris pv. raphani]|uniref:restriction endonuclease n=1 Tax=Xanthomonas campestris TaxID=339 RepID=UPI002B23B15C|nr:restriction endonuclease [Xanthomonas campestris]MEA9914535.1 restriction endonuclease [Xanthomonas campestris pv. raphani]
MSMVAKGTAFETRVHAAIGRELRSSKLGLDPASATLHAKKGYYSRDRDSEIIVDLSIEIWLPNATNWSLPWICECKDYGGSVPVDDVEEFKAKMDQISGANRKGVMAVTGALQQSALRYAQANGIGVVRLLPDDQVQHVLYQLSVGAAYPDRLTSSMVSQALVSPKYIGRNNSFFGLSGGHIHSGWQSVLRTDLQLSS